MTNWVQWDIDDEYGENPLGKPGEFAFNVEFEYDPGDPGYAYDHNGDGYPEYLPSATVSGAECKQIKLTDLPVRVPTKEEIKLLEDWFLSLLNKDKKTSAAD